MNLLKQGFSWWCFANRGVEPSDLLQNARSIGYEGVDLIDKPHWPLARKHGLRILAVAGHGTIENGLNRREEATRIEKELRAQIAEAEAWEIPLLICFSGNRNGMDDAAGLAACAETLGKIAPVAAAAGVTLALELLNSRVDHPDYQADHTAWGVQLCEAVGSPAVKLLYDIYHMQVMEGDVIRTIQSHHSHFAHYHTAGNPGRGMPDHTQELNYPAIYRAIAATGYDGFISHEFLPGADPLAALQVAYSDCVAATNGAAVRGVPDQ